MKTSYCLFFVPKRTSNFFKLYLNMFIKDKTHKLTNNTNIGKEEKSFWFAFRGSSNIFQYKVHKKIERQFHYKNVFRPNKLLGSLNLTIKYFV